MGLRTQRAETSGGSGQPTIWLRPKSFNDPKGYSFVVTGNTCDSSVAWQSEVARLYPKGKRVESGLLDFIVTDAKLKFSPKYENIPARWKVQLISSDIDDDGQIDTILELDLDNSRTLAIMNPLFNMGASQILMTPLNIFPYCMERTEGTGYNVGVSVKDASKSKEDGRMPRKHEWNETLRAYDGIPPVEWITVGNQDISDSTEFERWMFIASSTWIEATFDRAVAIDLVPSDATVTEAWGLLQATVGDLRRFKASVEMVNVLIRDEQKTASLVEKWNKLNPKAKLNKRESFGVSMEDSAAKAPTNKQEENQEGADDLPF